MSTNQTKTEPFPVAATESETETPAPSGTQTPGGDVGDAASVPANADEPAPGSSEQTPVVQGLAEPDLDEPDLRSGD